MTCSHPVSEPHIWTLSNQAKQIVMQCLACGEKTSPALARAKFTPEQLAAMPPLDLVLIEKTRAGRVEEKNARSAQRQVERVEHTEKYHEYLRSESWRQKRVLVLRRANYVCEGCLKEPAAQVHHLNYDHVFDELLFDLVAICDNCHAKAHGKDGV